MFLIDSYRRRDKEDQNVKRRSTTCRTFLQGGRGHCVLQCGPLSRTSPGAAGSMGRRDAQRQEDEEQSGRRERSCCLLSALAASSTRSTMRCALGTSARDLLNLRSVGCARALPITVRHGRHGNAASASLFLSHTFALFPRLFFGSLKYSRFF
ncbi:hypothetical protein CDAR_311461 [Caerostris darwini]|uniref:Uncharacterized protein n=1 Tax=Caerostris darwini TaxID=1538125 RepID=A0AAV4UTL5_9ARAC|nr:hypothetical protein CDAR_311461 [Caerostris darwini]